MPRIEVPTVSAETAIRDYLRRWIGQPLPKEWTAAVDNGNCSDLGEWIARFVLEDALIPHLLLALAADRDSSENRERRAAALAFRDAVYAAAPEVMKAWIGERR